jgi:retron-type reverse transcriptase
LANWKREEPVDEAKPFKIPKREAWEAFKRVKANQGAAGVDGQSIAEFEANLSGNLYKLWNRLSSRQQRSRASRTASIADLPGR